MDPSGAPPAVIAAPPAEIPIPHSCRSIAVPALVHQLLFPSALGHGVRVIGILIADGGHFFLEEIPLYRGQPCPATLGHADGAVEFRITRRKELPSSKIALDLSRIDGRMPAWVPTALGGPLVQVIGIVTEDRPPADAPLLASKKPERLLSARIVRHIGPGVDDADREGEETGADALPVDLHIWHRTVRLRQELLGNPFTP
ncbi:hypothetical protein H696_00475 [Fonticula alba]|uniref:Uncharacterized protein n=1 Tax=Fonticula alba TaxID=691883 RepID=A0A058ZG26_FONAL|nr:hypothetical protein H696_00475 [Fonticula alba]KCV72906.1 hypothetical protein H696_00475 [Fonticula alba]|eukprot:XP_009492607.1 hypothetical protein H696_00475 [Fonticula alba]